MKKHYLTMVEVLFSCSARKVFFVSVKVTNISDYNRCTTSIRSVPLIWGDDILTRFYNINSVHPPVIWLNSFQAKGEEWRFNTCHFAGKFGAEQQRLSMNNFCKYYIILAMGIYQPCKLAHNHFDNQPGGNRLHRSSFYTCLWCPHRLLTTTIR
jgi:hypothetical protein